MAPAVIRSDAKLVEITVKQNGLALGLPITMQSDTRIVEAALNNGRAVRYVAPMLLDDDKYRARFTLSMPRRSLFLGRWAMNKNIEDCTAFTLQQDVQIESPTNLTYKAILRQGYWVYCRVSRAM